MGIIWLGDMIEEAFLLALHFTIVSSLHISVVGFVATGGSAGEEFWDDV